MGRLRRKMRPLTVFLFRRDLRIVDNLALTDCCATAPEDSALWPVFVLDPRQASPALNKYHSAPAAAFLAACLLDLSDELQGQGAPLTVCAAGDRGQAGVLQELRDRAQGQGLRLERVAFNEDVTPYARERDGQVRAWCSSAGVRCVTTGSEDYTLVPPERMEKPYQVFTPFYNKYGAHGRSPPWAVPAAQRSPPARLGELLRGSPALAQPGAAAWEKLNAALSAAAPADPRAVPGRRAAQALLLRVKQGEHRAYGQDRDQLGLADGTTRMGCALKFGCVSVREALEAAQGNEPLVRQLYWRAFYDQVAWHFPSTLQGMTGAPRNGSLRPDYDAVRWAAGAQAAQLLQAWKDGRTGFPVVDAGMRELAATGHMHNRARMVTASVLVKDLGVDWREGERHFATRLADYHPPANSGGWQWVAGGGADAQQYTRVFSPWLQAKRFDPACAYVRQWVPELRSVPDGDILAWDEARAEQNSALTGGYPAPLVDHRSATAARLAEYRRALSKAEAQ